MHNVEHRFHARAGRFRDGSLALSLSIREAKMLQLWLFAVLCRLPSTSDSKWANLLPWVSVALQALRLVNGVQLSVSTTGGNASSPLLCGLMFEVSVRCWTFSTHAKRVSGHQQLGPVKLLKLPVPVLISLFRRWKDTRPIPAEQWFPKLQSNPECMGGCRRHFAFYRHSKRPDD